MKKLGLGILILTFSASSFSEGLADRRNEMSHSYDIEKAVIEHIHMMHGPTAAGHHSSGMGHDDMAKTGMDTHEMPLRPHYGGLRHSREYHGLTGHQFKRKVFGSNR